MSSQPLSAGSKLRKYLSQKAEFGVVDVFIISVGVGILMVIAALVLDAVL